jgi:hypothetical protein
LALIEKPTDSIDQQRLRTIPVLPLAALEEHRKVPAVRARRERIAELRARKEAERIGRPEPPSSSA